jgi:hypothetical protein
MITPETLDTLWPERHIIAERLNLHPSLRASFVPLTEALTDAQRDCLFPPERRQRVMCTLVALCLGEQPE